MIDDSFGWVVVALAMFAIVALREPLVSTMSGGPACMLRSDLSGDE